MSYGCRMTQPWAAQYFCSAKMRSWKVRGGVPSCGWTDCCGTGGVSGLGGMICLVLAGAKYSRGLTGLALEVHRADLVHLRDGGAVPRVAKMHALAQVLHQPRPEHRHALAARAPHAVEGHAIGARRAQFRADLLRGRVTHRVIYVR